MALLPLAQICASLHGSQSTEISHLLLLHTGWVTVPLSHCPCLACLLPLFPCLVSCSGVTLGLSSLRQSSDLDGAWLFGRDPAQRLFLSPVTCLCDQLEACSRSSTVSNSRKMRMGSFTQPSRPWPHGPAYLTEEALPLSGCPAINKPKLGFPFGYCLCVGKETTKFHLKYQT